MIKLQRETEAHIDVLAVAQQYDLLHLKIIHSAQLS